MDADRDGRVTLTGAARLSVTSPELEDLLEELGLAVGSLAVTYQR